jgi:hypothetical protein
VSVSTRILSVAVRKAVILNDCFFTFPIFHAIGYIILLHPYEMLFEMLLW